MNENRIGENPPQPKKTELQPIDSLETIKQNVAILKQKAEQAKRERAETVNEKFHERKALLEEAEKLNQLESETQESLKEFELLKQQEGVGKDPDFLKQVEAAEVFLEGVHQQQDKISKKIASLEAFPGVSDIIQAEDEKKRQEAEEKRETEKLKEDFRKEVELLADEAKALILKSREIDNKIREIENKFRTAYEKFIEVIDAAFTKLEEGKGKKRQEVAALLRRFRNDIRKWDEGSKISNIFKEFEELKKSLGFFSGKEKQTIDLILSKNTEREEYIELSGEYVKWRNKRSNLVPAEAAELEKKRKALGERYNKLPNHIQENIFYEVLNHRQITWQSGRFALNTPER